MSTNSAVFYLKMFYFSSIISNQLKNINEMLVYRTVEQSLFLSKDAWPPPPPPSSCGTELRLSRGRLELFMLQTRDTKTPQFKFKWRRKLGDGVKSRKKGKRGMRRSSKSRTRDATQQNPAG